MVILFDQSNIPESIFDLVFATDQQGIVGKELFKMMKSKGGEVNKTEMSVFATHLHEGKYECTLDTGPYKGKKVKFAKNHNKIMEYKK